MTRIVALGVVAVALSIAVAGATAGTNPNTLTLAVYGDEPYVDPAFTPQAEFDATPAFIKAINADSSVQEVVHVGDIHSGSEACTVAYDQAIDTLWTAFQRPLIYTPGDNEWSDCTKAKELAGKDVFGNGPDFNGDPLVHLNLVRSIFFANPGQTLGQHPMQVVSQKNAFDPAHPTDAQFVENVMWEQSKTVFVTLNLPGGSNNDTDTWNGPAKNQAAEDAERAARTAADIRWLNAAFAQAEAGNAHSVVIIGQADMWDTTDAASHQTNYEPIIAAIASNSQTYGKPVLYLNGDSHIYRSDNPLQQNSSCDTETEPCTLDAWLQHPYYNVPNFHRIVVHGSTFPLEWLKLSIDPRAAWENASTVTSWGPFSWQRKTQTQLTP
ncbi:MAG TPA: hypothetical protein VHU82_15725 [Vicinamibacterales bacterium]|jgi:hypothetical protein|nr:hypothetical protein [Vicinamibacterales bacterium]